ncbi:MAG: type II secretion system protein N [Gammaproteobacteria bacterium]|nr:type II secretion system protein N [Gammaproteobacteria bacterium]
MARPPRRDRAAQDAPRFTKKHWRLLALGLLALVVFSVATLPASLVDGRMKRYGVTAVSYAGSIWSGTATGLAWQGATLGDLRWSVAPLALLRGRLGAHLQLTRPDGSVRADITAALSGNMDLRGTQVDLPLEALNALPLGLPKGWRGRVRAALPDLRIVKGWPTSVQGTIDMDDLVAPPPRNASIGSYHATLPDPQAPQGGSPGITARVAAKEGPFAVDARLTLAPDRNFLLEGTLAPRGDTPPALRRSLEILGPADAQGRRPFSVSGTL